MLTKIALYYGKEFRIDYDWQTGKPSPSNEREGFQVPITSHSKEKQNVDKAVREPSLELVSSQPARVSSQPVRVSSQPARNADVIFVSQSKIIHDQPKTRSLADLTRAESPDEMLIRSPMKGRDAFSIVGDERDLGNENCEAKDSDEEKSSEDEGPDEIPIESSSHGNVHAKSNAADYELASRPPGHSSPASSLDDAEDGEPEPVKDAGCSIEHSAMDKASPSDPFKILDMCLSGTYSPKKQRAHKLGEDEQTSISHGTNDACISTPSPCDLEPSMSPEVGSVPSTVSDSDNEEDEALEDETDDGSDESSVEEEMQKEEDPAESAMHHRRNLLCLHGHDRGFDSDLDCHSETSESSPDSEEVEAQKIPNRGTRSRFYQPFATKASHYLGWQAKSRPSAGIRSRYELLPPRFGADRSSDSPGYEPENVTSDTYNVVTPAHGPSFNQQRPPSPSDAAMPRSSNVTASNPSQRSCDFFGQNLPAVPHHALSQWYHMANSDLPAYPSCAYTPQQYRPPTPARFDFPHCPGAYRYQPSPPYTDGPFAGAAQSPIEYGQFSEPYYGGDQLVDMEIGHVESTSTHHDHPAEQNVQNGLDRPRSKVMISEIVNSTTTPQTNATTEEETHDQTRQQRVPSWALAVQEPRQRSPFSPSPGPLSDSDCVSSISEDHQQTPTRLKRKLESMLEASEDELPIESRHSSPFLQQETLGGLNGASCDLTLPDAQSGDQLLPGEDESTTCLRLTPAETSQAQTQVAKPTVRGEPPTKRVRLSNPSRSVSTFIYGCLAGAALFVAPAAVLVATVPASLHEEALSTFGVTQMR